MPFDTCQQKWLPLRLNPQDITTLSSCPGFPLPELGKVYPAEHQFHALLSSYDPQVSCLNLEEAVKSSQKRLLVFDQSRTQTRVLQCGLSMRFSSPVAREKELSNDYAKVLLQEDLVENCYNGQESEMHEDTEEIDALLYSDDEENDDCESDDDEVMSTGHSPFTYEQQACNKTTVEVDETISCDDGPLRKKQKLVDHSYKDSSQSFVGTESVTKVIGLSDEKVLDSNISSKQEAGSGLSSEDQSRKDKIQTGLRILESVVPGSKGKEALLLLDEAIDYLKLLKQNLNSSKAN
ncbi:unnamed protein product [Cochlearia groenlandica]